MPPAGFRLSFPADLQPTSLCPARSAVYTAHFSWSPGETRFWRLPPRRPWHVTIVAVGGDVISDISPGVDKPLVWMHGKVKSPPFSAAGPHRGRNVAGTAPGGSDLGFCRTRARCGRPSNAATSADSGYERAVADRLRLDADAVIIVEVFSRKTPATPQACWPSAHAVSERHDRATRAGSVNNSAHEPGDNRSLSVAAELSPHRAERRRPPSCALSRSL